MNAPTSPAASRTSIAMANGANMPAVIPADAAAQAVVVAAGRVADAAAGRAAVAADRDGKEKQGLGFRGEGSVIRSK